MRTSLKCTPTLGVSALFFALLCALSLLSSIAQAAPTISGTPKTKVLVSTYYSWAPTARDPAVAQRTLRYSIVNKPSWAVFSVYSGKLEGTVPRTPATWSNIRISVRSATGTATLPAFSITSYRSDTSGGTTNRPPVLSGTPSSSVTAGNAYAFRPTGSDPEGRTLTWSITNRPSWATFSTSSGALTGTPTSSHVGTYSGIAISASDGTNRTALPSFSIAVNAAGSSNGSATLSWTPPTNNTNGTTLTNLAGYRIYYGTSSSALNRTVQVANAGVTRYVVPDLSAGTWYFSVRAYTSTGVESGNSNTASKTIR
ncbi:putative Ig domain-containing protein [Peristeroidobacter agariperforans]|uniref:putative Ig domain-containing protein n=1 Tax=Peristeroidobacter agariperforans TaxID=268404 RepID=UPI00101C2F73|nr:putative Ig domain-containing protein [Peristeroidobacter agariperforans]